MIRCRATSHAAIALASISAALGLEAFGWHAPGEAHAYGIGLGASLMAQEPPPAVGRPTGGTIGPRLDPTETAVALPPTCSSPSRGISNALSSSCARRHRVSFPLTTT